MAAILMIDSLGKRYGLLPSEVLNRSNTFDIYIMDAALSYENYVYKKQLNNGVDPAPNYSEEELLAMVQQNKRVQ
jgi:hypothetical protein